MSSPIALTPMTWEDLITQTGRVIVGTTAVLVDTELNVRPAPPRRPTAATPSEDDEQRALFAWRAVMLTQEPLLDLLHHLANGKKRPKAVAGQLKALGVKAGMPDLFLPVARHGAHGLYLELKTQTGRTTPLQRALHACLQDEGYAVEVCHGWLAAARTLCWYLDRPDLAWQLGDTL